MKSKLLILMLILPFTLSAQYYGERVTEKSFERSNVYFKSNFLNTFGLFRFKNVAPGLIEDPFLDLHLNPANLPEFQNKTALIYLDFRGDRSETPFSAYPVEYDSRALDISIAPYIDPRWFSQTRTEPEPVFSLGVLTYPFGDANKNFFAGATYQLIHKNEQFYSVPTGIYNARAGYDSFGRELSTDVPIIDRFSGEDEMMINGHLFSSYLGYRVNQTVDLGVSLNSVFHSREGIYLNASQGPYGDINPYQNEYRNLRERTQNYDHMDLSGGVRIHLNDNSSFGIKIGSLSGDVNQEFLSTNDSKYNYGDANNPANGSEGFFNSSTNQSWNQDGNTKYARLSFSHELSSDKKFSFYFRYAESNIDLSNSSVIRDTSFYTSQWSWDTNNSYYLGNSAFSDIRSSTGIRNKTTQQGLFSYKWQLTPKNSIFAAIYFSRDHLKINSNEPVLASRFSHSEYFYQPSQTDTLFNDYRLFEDKSLLWNYESRNWSFQIPIMVNFKLNPNWSVMLGVNRILNSWNIKEQTTAIFNKREREDNGIVKVETNFGERYTTPRKRITEDHTDVLVSFQANLSQELQVNFLINPDFEDHFRVAQWWLSFRSFIK